MASKQTKNTTDAKKLAKAQGHRHLPKRDKPREPHRFPGYPARLGTRRTRVAG